MNVRSLALASVAIVLLSACASTNLPTTVPSAPSGQAPSAASVVHGPLTISSADVRDGEPLPDEMLSGSLTFCDGPNISPDVSWSPGPEGTTSYALHFADSTGSELRTYWLVYDIPLGVTEVPSGESNSVDGQRGLNAIGLTYYIGPCPEWESEHTYELTVYALDAEAGERGLSHQEFLERMSPSILDQATITATRRGPDNPNNPTTSNNEEQP